MEKDTIQNLDDALDSFWMTMKDDPKFDDMYFRIKNYLSDLQKD